MLIPCKSLLSYGGSALVNQRPDANNADFSRVGNLRRMIVKILAGRITVCRSVTKKGEFEVAIVGRFGENASVRRLRRGLRQ
jgi:hypothetical protein